MGICYHIDSTFDKLLLFAGSKGNRPLGKSSNVPLVHVLPSEMHNSLSPVDSHKHQEMYAGRAPLQSKDWPLWSQERCHRSLMLGLWTGAPPLALEL